MESIVEKINSVIIEPEYDMLAEDCKAIYEVSEQNIIMLMYNSFKAGYIQGKKSEQEKITK